VIAGPGPLLVGLDLTGTPAARDAGGRITNIRGFGDRTEAAARAGVPA
jgi:hypothetical protein